MLSKPIARKDITSHYQKEISDLKTVILSSIDLYKQRTKETNILKNDFLFKKERHIVINKLINMKDIDSEDEEQNCIIKYITTHPHPEFTEKNEIISHIDQDVLSLLGYLYKISLYAKRFRDDPYNSFRIFCKNIIIHMKANLERNYPKSIVNYTCFMFNIDGYPYCTPSKRIYSINNYPINVENKINNVIIYMKNTDALISYFFDIIFNDENKNEIQIEEKILRTAYCLCIALLAYRCEYIEYNFLTENIFGTRNMERKRRGRHG
jgi:hypothetical protein